ncbi:MAG TPA: hypothetical protein VGG28_11125 [Kofleriaceae bacterium]
MLRLRRFDLWFGALALALLNGCAPKSPVEYIDGQCLISGVPASLAQVESRQAEITQHILSRQPVLTAIAVAAVVIAGAGYLNRILTMVLARRSQSFADRLRARLERYREHPVRQFALVGGVLCVLAIAGVAYVSLDSDKRQSERSLGTLQFCHIALRSANEQHALAEQREHLASIQSTEHDIRALVDRLPPAEQEKAREIATQLQTSLGQQRALVSQYATRADTTAKAVVEQGADLQRGISKLDGEVVDLQTMPAAIVKLATDVRELRARHDALDARLDVLASKLDEIANRPPPVCALPPPPPPAKVETSSAQPKSAPAKSADTVAVPPADAASGP